MTQRHLAILAAFVGLALAHSPAQARNSCDRECLIGVGQAYLQALSHHDLKLMPLADKVRFTENGSELALGDGLWATVEGLRHYRWFVADPISGNVGVFASVEESGQRALVAARLKAPNGKISQIETLVARNDPSSHMSAPASIDLRKALVTPLASGHAVSRAATIDAADSYFVGLGNATDKGVAFAPDCVRHENGVKTTGNPDFGNDISKLDCQHQFATGFSKFITRLRDRRWIVDEKTGVAMAILFFDHAGTVKDVKLADGSIMTVPYPFNRPFSFELFEAFKIDQGKIHEIEAILTSVPYGMKSGWPSRP